MIFNIIMHVSESDFRKLLKGMLYVVHSNSQIKGRIIIEQMRFHIILHTYRYQNATVCEWGGWERGARVYIGLVLYPSIQTLTSPFSKSLASKTP